MKLCRKFYFLLILALCIGYDTAASSWQAVTLHAITLEQYDDELHSLFVDHFFNQNDTMPFPEIVGKIIVILEHKEKYLDGHLKTKCIEVIKQFKKHQYDKSFQNWAAILRTPSLPELLPLKTQIYLDEIPLLDKIRTLKRKLG